MEWIKLHKDKLPEHKVLAANFKEGTYGYTKKILGYVYYHEYDDNFGCVDEHLMLENCTHYIDIDKYDIE